MSLIHYVMGPDGETPEPFDIGPNFERMAEWAARLDHARIIRQDDLPCGGRVSTCFLGIDLGYGRGPPRTFETMAFDAAGAAAFQHRETTKRRALKTHMQVMEHAAASASDQ